MVRVKVLVCNSPVKVIETFVTREGERAIDQSKVVLPICASICIGNQVNVIQDAVNLDNLVGAYMFQGSTKDESGRCNNAYGSISYPRIDVNLVYCDSTSTTSNKGIRDSISIDTGSITCVAPGKVNSKGMVFDGVNDYTTITKECIYDIDQTTQLSLSAWIKTSDTCVPLIAKKATGSSSKGWEFGINCAGQLDFRMTNTSSSNELHIRGDTPVNTCVWTHVTVTYNGIPGCGADAVKIYINN